MTIPYVGCSTPWGKAQAVTPTPHPEIYFVSTAGHGGVKVTGKALQDLRRRNAAKSCWFEEDCAWSVVALAFPEAFPGAYDNALRTAKDLYPDLVRDAFCIKVKLEESRELRRRAFYSEHAGHELVSCAFGDWCVGSRNTSGHTDVPQGMVGVLTQRIAPDNVQRVTVGAWLVPAKLYRSRDEFGFWIDTNNVPQGVSPWPPCP
jgi:hypothetical protein